MLEVLILAITPILIVLFYVFLKDKYEQEPLSLLILSVFLGCLLVFPAIIIKAQMNYEFSNIFFNCLYKAFILSGFIEESLKFLVFFVLIWFNKNFNEKFDGIVYAVYISMGFAAVENFYYIYNSEYLFQSKLDVAFSRAILSIPLHALCGVAMGYYFSKAKFELKNTYLILALIIPVFSHGLYNFFVIFENNFLENSLKITFLLVILQYWRVGFKWIKEHSEDSAFKNEDFNK